VKILLADAAWLSQDRLATVFAALDSKAEIFRCSDVVGLHRILGNHSDIALVVVDEAVLAEDEEQLFLFIHRIAPSAEVVLWTNDTNRDRYIRGIYFGAVGILLKSASDEELAVALQLLLHGQCVFPRSILARGPADRTDQHERRPEENLTPREREIMDAIGHGQTVARIAESLTVSPHTVRVHVTRIMKKLDLHDRSALMYYAIKRPRRRTF
jgi:DNA-binding NarL/FixJ family response regulator